MRGILVFILVSLGYALSSSLIVLHGMRFLQGLGGAAAMSIGLTLYLYIFPTCLLGTALGVQRLTLSLGALIRTAPTFTLSLLVEWYRSPTNPGDEYSGQRVVVDGQYKLEPSIKVVEKVAAIGTSNTSSAVVNAKRTSVTSTRPASEHFFYLHQTLYRYHAVRHCDFPDERCGVAVAAGGTAAASGFPDHPGLS